MPTDEHIAKYFGRAVELIAKWDDGAWDEVPRDELVDLLRRLLWTPSLGDAMLMDAILRVTWHTGRVVQVRMKGTHGAYEVIEVGDHEFAVDSADDRNRLIAWAEALRTSEANAPLPEPPARKGPDGG